jgi:mannose-1-phosphate guanylyltransferase
MENSKAYVCIMAGGSGERFWPMSRKATPKHLLKLFSDRTLVEEAVRRLDGVVPLANVFVLTNHAQLEATRAALPFLPSAQIVAEPAKRDTAAAAALATAWVRARDPEAVMALLPADSLITNQTVYARQLHTALARAAGTNALLTFAIKPSYPATGFGYLEMADDLGDGFRRVSRFVEKPDEATAQAYIAGGNHAWNAGMFVWKVSSFLAEAEKHTPMLAQFIRDFPRSGADRFLIEKFPTLEPKVSVDYAIMEKAAAVETLVAEFDWDDVGAWTALPTHMPQDAAGNTSRGAVLKVDAADNIAVSNGRLIALCGVQDLVVVETPDAVLVCHRDAVQQIKQLMPDLPDAVR